MAQKFNLSTRHDDYRAREESMVMESRIWGNNLSQFFTCELVYAAKKMKFNYWVLYTWISPL